MTTTTTSSQFGLEDMEVLLWEPSSPMADSMGFEVSHSDHCKGGPTSVDGMAAPVSPFNLSSQSSPTFYSPPHSPPVIFQGKSGISSEPLPFPLLDNSGQLRDAAMDGKDDMFGDLDWMAERMDLSDLDLDSLIGPCIPDKDSPSDPDEFMASLELDSLPIQTLSSIATASAPDVPYPQAAGSDPSEVCGVPSPVQSIPEPQEDSEIKSEPTSCDSPRSTSPSIAASPAYTLDLGSEVDVPTSEVGPVAVAPPVQRVVLSLSPTRIVLLLAPQNNAGLLAAAPTVTPHSPSAWSSRSRPYPKPNASPPSPTVKFKSCADESAVSKVPGNKTDGRTASKAPKNKKEKKMEQNKTAATRYRQKKRVEQDTLLIEHTTLERKNVELSEKAESMAREIEYLKELMEEVRVARLKSGP
ncbi:cyclic AMP-dependent transcription factor ATF-4-like [Entelurus aequoreus]|uniref:cyclic AMP-dependent transcription factor ATF-4-like n=1 Tax=Entelurus aequoreus TaxID=161455 RepID=UPI002B1E3524|nr:cyclic AMP-dependent transcription factor ATF-4-like [Entelurus aequoreus]